MTVANYIAKILIQKEALQTSDKFTYQQKQDLTQIYNQLLRELLPRYFRLQGVKNKA